MKSFLWSTGLRVVDAAKRELKNSKVLRSMPLARYTYLFDMSKAIIVPEMKLVFVPTPKVANRSMKAAIAKTLNPDFSGEPHHGWSYTPVAAMRRNNYFCFGFVRNPLDRLLSCYAQKIVKYSREMCIPNEFWRYGKLFYPEMTFSDFVKAVAGIPDRISDIHFRSQHTFFYYGEKLMVDFVGRYEHLDRDWGILQERFGFPALPHYNLSSHDHWQSVYTRELARIAFERYRKDIELFGYAEEIGPLIQ